MFLRIAAALTEAIRSGLLSPGDRLPGSRKLAATFGVHRNTLLAALAELVAEGWLETEAARGTFVSRALPEVAVNAERVSGRGRSAKAGFAVPPPLRQRRSFDHLAPGLLVLSGGTTDVRLLPSPRSQRPIGAPFALVAASCSTTPIRSASRVCVRLSPTCSARVEVCSYEPTTS